MSCSLFQKFLISSDSLHVYAANKLIFTSDKTHLIPLLEYINQFSPFHQEVTIIDKIMGNGAALLSVLANSKEVYSPLGSQLAINTLDKYKINYHITNITPYIKKNHSEEMCPMEKLSLHKDPEEFYTAIINLTH
ncbi:MAG: DUF1893 domain-containing protein [Dehalococcoidales bacterium]|nr:DUF1893 domain-containing protein [Dehalococcoidales bacterium]